MPEPDVAGLSRLDADRAHSMADEGGSSAALVENCDEAAVPWKAATTALACVVGLLAGVGLIRLLRSR